MPIETMTFEELRRWVTGDELTTLLGRDAEVRRGVLAAAWVARLAVPLEARGFRVDGAGAPIHFWRDRQDTGVVFSQ